MKKSVKETILLRKELCWKKVEQDLYAVWHRPGIWKKAVSAMLTGVMIVTSCVPAMAASNELKLISSSPITSGAVLNNYTWDISDGMVKAAVLEIDLTDPYVELDIVPGKGKFTQRATVSTMANNTNAIAMVNGDFYNTRAEGAPISTTVIDGKLASSQSYLTGVYCLGITRDRTAYIGEFSFSGAVSNDAGAAMTLSGLNKTFYWEETTKQHSHLDKLHLYNDLWGGSKRGIDSYTGIPAEILVKDGKVVDTAFEGGFDTAVPEGYYIVHGDGKAAEFLKNNFAVGDAIHIEYAYEPVKDWELVIGGHGLLVDNGQVVKYTKDLSSLGGVRARTAVGISKDGKKLYMIAVEGRTAESKGITLGNLSLLLTKLGVWKAVNLDGGGSTTMVSRPLGETSRVRVINPESNGAERSVVEGLGVYSSAPAGNVMGISIRGSQSLLIGESATYTLSAYDQYYNPVDTTNTIQLTESTELGVLSGHTFTAKQAGTAKLEATSSTYSTSLPIHIVGGDEIKTITLDIDHMDFADGSTHQLSAYAILKDGTGKTVSPEAFTWSVGGFDGSIDEKGVLTIHSLENTYTGTVKASYDGFETTLALKFADLETVKLTLDSKTLWINDKSIEMDIAPTIVNNRTVVPISFIANALNAMVDWDGVLQTAYVAYDDTLVEIIIHAPELYVNGEVVAIDTPAEIINGRTMVPLRAVADGLGLEVYYDNETRTITIIQPEPEAQSNVEETASETAAEEVNEKTDEKTDEKTVTGSAMESIVTE